MHRALKGPPESTTPRLLYLFQAPSAGETIRVIDRLPVSDFTGDYVERERLGDVVVPVVGDPKARADWRPKLFTQGILIQRPIRPRLAARALGPARLEHSGERLRLPAGL